MSAVSFIEEQLRWKGVCIGLSLDIEGAFNRTTREAIRVADDHDITKTIIWWIMSKQEGRNLSTELQGCLLEGSLSKRCLQDGIFSSLLWKIVSDY